MSADAITNSEYRIVHDGLLRLHELFLLGQERSDEAAEIRDSSEGSWRQLPQEQRQLLSGLSKDLNDIKRVTSKEVGGGVSPVFVHALHAQRAGRYAEALDLLRANKTIAPFSRISLMRGRNWEEMGEAKTALLFFEHAVKLAPENEEYQAAALGAFCEAYPDKGKIKIEKILDEPQAYPATVIVRACEIRFHETVEPEDERNYLSINKQIIQALHIALVGMQTGPRPNLLSEAQPVYGVVCSLLAACCRNLGMIDPAFHYYTTAIGLDPLNPPLLIARGMVLYGQSGFVTEFAIQDFIRAIQLGTDIGIPYYFLAHYFLLGGQYERTLEAVAKGLGQKGGKRLKSEMMEYRAIALAALSRSPHEVTEAFQEALKIDEVNDRAKMNLEVYNNMLKQKLTRAIEQPWLLKLDPISVASELPKPRTLQEIVDAHSRMAG